jgi:hypothetical protein
MLKPTLTLSAALWLVVGLGPSTSSAQEKAQLSTQGSCRCKVITRLPYKILKSGDYCLGSSLTVNISEGRAIDVAADNVRLDLRGFEIDGSAGGPFTDVVGVWAVDRKNITIRNGAITGFGDGISIVNANDSGKSRGHLVEKLLIKNSRGIGIRLTGDYSTIRRNVISGTGGPGFAAGIRHEGSHGTIVENRINDTRATSDGPNSVASAIDLVDTEARTVSGNRIDGVFGALSNYGIRCGKPYETLNTVQNADIPFSSCDAYPFASNEKSQSPRYGMALAGGLMGALALIKRFVA